MPEKAMQLKSPAYLRRVRAAVGRRAGEAVALAEGIADLAEPPMQERQSSRRLEEFLAGNGFRVTRPYRHLPTAFRAVAGSGRPVIAILAEYDALPDCGNRLGQWGHGCGHHLLGAGAALAGAAAARVLEQAHRAGRIVVFGCPAEESLGGKVFMAEQRAFAGLDAVLAWHPGGTTFANQAGGSAMDSIIFRFRGRTAHAAGSPEQGRSALDAVLLTDVAVNYLREHVEENTRMHSVVTSGGSAPNVVPDQAEIWYYLRGRDRKQVDELRRRVIRCARAAALATETKWRMTVLTCNTERLPVAALAAILDRLLRRCGPPKVSFAEQRAAAKVLGAGKKYTATVEPIRTNQTRGSSDEDNVSWFAPLGAFTLACVPKGTTAHHRHFAALSRRRAAHRGMLKAAEVLALAAVELAVNRPLLKRARTEFRAARRGKKYRLPISPGVLGPVQRRAESE